MTSQVADLKRKLRLRHSPCTFRCHGHNKKKASNSLRNVYAFTYTNYFAPFHTTKSHLLKKTCTHHPLLDNFFENHCFISNSKIRLGWIFPKSKLAWPYQRQLNVLRRVLAMAKSLQTQSLPTTKFCTGLPRYQNSTVGNDWGIYRTRPLLPTEFWDGQTRSKFRIKLGVRWIQELWFFEKIVHFYYHLIRLLFFNHIVLRSPNS